MALASPRPPDSPRRSWSWFGLRKHSTAMPARASAEESLARLEAILGRPDFRIPGDRLVRASADIIYSWVREGRPLYIGMSTVGLLRPLSRAHDVTWALGDGDQLLVWKMPSAQEARNQERRARCSARCVRRACQRGRSSTTSTDR